VLRRYFSLFYLSLPPPFTAFVVDEASTAVKFHSVFQLPEMDGYSVLNSMKDNFQNSDLKKVPVIVWTNLSEDSDITKALSSGATMYLRKSDYNGDDLVEKIKDIMSKGSTS
jgi:CheY-like chemotaxis protein